MASVNKTSMVKYTLELSETELRAIFAAVDFVYPKLAPADEDSENTLELVLNDIVRVVADALDYEDGESNLPYFEFVEDASEAIENLDVSYVVRQNREDC